jgi:hypothetical protein
MSGTSPASRATSPQSLVSPEAFAWWNSQVHTYPHRIPEVVIPEIANTVWSKLCPMCLLFVINEQDTRAYWESVHSIVAMFDSTPEIPHPLTDFPKFITRLFALRHVLNPQTVIHSLVFIDKFGFHDAPHFFLYQSPVFLFDPVLYLDTILYCRYRHHKLWTSFVSNPKLADAFVQLYSSFMRPITTPASLRSWNHRILMTEAVYCMIEDIFPSHPEILKLVVGVLDLCIPLLQDPPYDIGISLIRPIFGMISILIGAMPRDQVQTRVMRLITILHQWNSPHLLMVVRCAIAIRPVVVNHGHIVKLIAARGVRSVDDLEILFLMADSPSLLAVLSQLVLSAITNNFWMRACFSLIQELLVKYGNQTDVHDWFSLAVRRLFLFIALAHGRKKYRTRSLCLCECLVALMQTNVGGIGSMITTIASSIGTRPMPSFFTRFFTISAIRTDDLVIHEFELLLGMKIHLKTFPFDAKRKEFALQTLKDGPVGKAPPTVRVLSSFRVTKSAPKLPPVSVVVRKTPQKPRKKPMAPPLIKLAQNRAIGFPMDIKLAVVGSAPF